MLYGFLQWVGGVALHWFYRDVRVVHGDRIPRSGPLLVAVNHQNAVVDAILAQWVVPRPLKITAKATLAEGFLGAMLVKLTGIIPLRRTSDESNPADDPTRNRRSFERIIDELRRDQAILVFPEGKSHNDPEVAPLKTGLARAAMRARESGVTGIHIVSIGITFESKAEPGTVVVAQVGQLIAMDEWPGDNAHSLTKLIADNLSAVSFTGNVQNIPNQIQRKRSPLIRAAARWGHITHKVPIMIARRLAVRQSSDEGEPAMYTMTYGVALTLLAYAIQVPIVWFIAGGMIAMLYLASLVIGAYYAAYADHDY
ncbi:MAG: 1-acyl-sn-glycerol-3-phosphate acyltransferase [Gemmatimonadaceae bacterium]